MSLILDAMKKLDRERSSRRRRVSNIASEILRTDQSHLRSRMPLYVIIVLLTAIVTAVFTYFISTESPTLSKSPPALPPPSISTESPPSTGEKILPEPKPTELVKESREEIRQEAPKIKKQTEESIPSSPKKAKQDVVPEEVPLVPEKKKAPIEPIQERPAPITERPAPTPVSLRLTMISYDKDPARRLASVNDTIVTEGTIIEGMRVDEISSKYVRFSHKGQFFEIPLGSSATIHR